MFSPQSSVIVSLLSGVGLVAVVSLAPVKTFDPKGGIEPKRIDSHPAEKIKKSSGENQDESLALEISRRSVLQNEFSLTVPVSELLKSEGQAFDKSILPSESESLRSSIRERTEWDLYSNNFGERKIFFQKDGLVMRGIANSSELYFSSNKRDYSSFDSYGNRRADAYELQYSLSSSVGAVFQGGSYDLSNDRHREQRNMAMAGLSIKTGEFFSARVLTGDTTNTNTPTTNFNYNPLNPNRPNDLSRRDREDIKQLYEWQANFTPSDYFKLQTSLFNQRNENSLNMSSPDGGKVSVFMGGKNVQMNLRYNYMTNKNQRNGASGQGFNPSQDLASLGIIFFLDQSQRYSLYVGNNFYNVLNDPANQVKDASGRSPSTFTASFRGKTPSATRSSFFLNFQNQFYKDGTTLGMPGVLPLGLQQGKSFYEYATSLGVDVAF